VLTKSNDSVDLEGLMPKLLLMLEEMATILEEKWGIQVVVTSAKRPTGSSPDTMHPDGKAADIRGHAQGNIKTEFIHYAVSVVWAYLCGKYQMKFGIGIYPHQEGEHIHVELGIRRDSWIRLWIK